MDFDETSDILGGRLHVSPHSNTAWFDPAQITLLLGLGLAAIFAWIRVAPHYRQWRETRYRKAMRRRHGIPDDDNRPFNVAYAAASQGRKHRGGRASTEEGVPSPLHREEERMVSAPHSAFGVSGVLGGGYGRADNGFRTDPDSVGLRPDQFVCRPTSQADPTPQSMHLPYDSSSSKARQNSVKLPVVTRPLHGKHALDDEAGSELETQPKKTRVEGEDLIDGDEEAEWHDSDKHMDVDDVRPAKRGSKRGASTEDDEGLALSRAERRDKRPRKVSIDKSLDHDMEAADDADVEGAVRGKKRDRDEAGSTFGGDDSLNDDDEKPQRRRRRRTTSNKLQGLTRGQKRGRDLNSADSDLSDSELPRRESTRKKRGKRTQDEFAPISLDPLCKGRHIGEEWEANGVMYKVGPNGQRLRQELVKKSRSRFPMPSDSQHPDRRAHVDVYVETWMSEEEYQTSKERDEMAWQDMPVISEPQTPSRTPDSPSKPGKNLLWTSTMAPREVAIRREVFKQSVATNVGLRLNVFPPPHSASTRRISTIYQAPASPVTDSPKLQKQKSYSKWEKQDLEAAAMSKLRDRQQAARNPETKKNFPSITSTSASTPSLFNASVTPAPSAKGPDQSTITNTPFSFAPGPAKPSTTEAPKSTNITSGSSAPSSSAKAPSTFSIAPTAGANVPPTFGPQSTAQSTPSIPNIFAKPPAQAPTSSAPTLFAPKPVLGGSAPGAGSVAPGSAPKPMLSFGPPSGQPVWGTGTTGGPSNSETAKADQPKPAPGVNLLSRLGMGPPPTHVSAATNATPTSSFAKPEAAPPKATTAASSDPAKPSTTTATPKFNFGMSSTPSPATPAQAVNGAPVPTTTTPASTTKFNPGVNNNGSPFTPFGAGTGGGNAAATSSSASGSPFTFGVPSGSSAPKSAAPSPFGSTPTNGGKGPEVPKSAFLFGANPSTTTTTPSVFGGAAAGPTPSPFGGAAAAGPTSSPFGGAAAAGPTPSPFAAGPTPSPFGGAAAAGPTPSPFGAKLGEAPKSVFGSTSTPSVFGSNAQNGTPKADTQTTSKPLFSFSAASTSTPASTPAPTFGTFGGSSAPVFGAASTTPAATSENKPSVFSISNTNTAALPPAPTPTTTENKPVFSFNFGAPNNSSSATSAPTSAFGAGNHASGPFGTATASQPSQTGTTNPFNFSAPSGAITFGQNTQK